MIFYTVYKTINLINGKFYIGVHKTTNPNDSYLGSGYMIQSAIKKYGPENFKKEILCVFETAKEAFAKEKELVNEDLLSSGQCYNLTTGGNGGAGPGKLSGPGRVGLKRTKETKIKMSLAQKGQHAGENSPLYKKIWVNNGIVNKRVSSEEISDKWNIGRLKWITDEIRIKMKESHLGKIQSEETKEKMRKPKQKKNFNAIEPVF